MKLLINVLCVMFYKLALNTAFRFFFVNFNGNKERFMHTAKINLDRSRGAFGTLY
jgi:hypothetical protein